MGKFVNRWFAVISVVGILLPALCFADEKSHLANPFFAMDTAGGDLALIKQLGFAGVNGTFRSSGDRARCAMKSTESQERRYIGLMKISAYVPCHNNESTIGETLAALKDQTRAADELLFINDRCTDASPVIARDQGLQVIDLVAARGLAAGRNCALSHAEGDVLLGIDADVVIARDFLEKLEQQFVAQPDVAAICGRLDERFTQTPADLWRAVHMRQHHGPEPILNPNFLFGSTMACRIAAAREIGGWNDRFVTNFEDVDLSIRLKTAGHNILYTPACQAWHLRRDTVRSVLKALWSWNQYGFTSPYSSIEYWQAHRLPMIWKYYRTHRRNDIQYPTLPPITFLLPWSWMIRDLNVLDFQAGPIGDVRDVIAVARSVLNVVGMDGSQIEGAAAWMEKLCKELEIRSDAGNHLRSDLAQHIQEIALENIPDANYWRSLSSALISAAPTRNQHSG